MLKSTPELQVFAEPRENVPRRKIDAFVVADMLADVLQPNAATAGVYVTGNSGFGGKLGDWNDWKGLSNGLKLVNVGFARFLPSGDVAYGAAPGQSGRGGFFVLPQYRPADSKINGQGEFGGYGSLGWDATEGDWLTLPRHGTSDAGNAIWTAGKQEMFRAQTDVDFSANQAVRLDLSFLGKGQGNNVTPGFRARVGKDLSFVLRHGRAATLEREGFTKGGDPTWKVLKTLEAAGECNLRGGLYRLELKHIDGQLVWDLNGHSVWVPDATEPNKNSISRPQHWNWDAAPLRVIAENVRVRIETTKIEFPAEGGTVERSIARTLASEQQGQNTNAFPGGWLHAGTDVPVTVTTEDKRIIYKAHLKPSEDAIHTPFLGQILLSYAPVWTEPTESRVNITRAVTGASITLAAPPTQAGSEGTLDIDRGILERVPGGMNVSQDYCPVTIKARWRSDMGEPGPWSHLFTGYFFGQTRASAGYGNKTARVTLRDLIVRLRAPSALVDHRFRPLGMLLMERMKAIENADEENGGFDPEDGVYDIKKDPTNPWYKPASVSIYGGDCVKEILKMQLGPAYAAQLNGDGNPRRFFPKSHPPLLSSNDLLGSYLPLATAFNQGLSIGGLGDGIPLPAPYGEDCLGWVQKFCEDELAMFFVGHVDRDTSAPPVPIYARYLNYLDKAILWNIADAIGVTTHTGVDGGTHQTFSEEDVNFLMSEASSETRPESDINRILCWADLGENKNPFTPALRMAEAKLPPSDANSDVYSWERSKLIRSNFGFQEGAAELIAALALQQVAGLKKQWPRLRFRGEGGVQVGDVIRPRMSNPGSDKTMNIDGRTFRATSVTHDFTIGGTGSDWTTAAGMRPLARIEDIRFRRNNNLPMPTSWFG